MLRDGNTFFYVLPHNPSLILRPHDVCGRREKLSAKKKRLLNRIDMCKKQLEIASEGPSDAIKIKLEENISKYSRQLISLQNNCSHKIHKTYNKRSKQEIKKYVLMWIDDAVKNGDCYVRAEDIAYQLNVKTHFVKQVFQELNVEGILSQAENRAAHDSPRDPWGFAGTSLWSSSIYRILNKDLSDN